MDLFKLKVDGMICISALQRNKKSVSQFMVKGKQVLRFLRQGTWKEKSA